MLDQFKEVYEILPNYIANFTSILKRPRTYLTKYGEEETSFKDAVYFFLISNVLSVWFIPKFFGENVSSTLQAKGLLLSLLPAVLGSFAIWISWQIVRRPIEFEKVLRVNLFISGFLGLIGVCFASFSIGFLILDDAKLAEAFYKGIIRVTLNRSEEELLLANQILSYGFNSWSVIGHNIVSFAGMVVTVVFSILTWNVFARLANASLLKTAMSYLLAVIFQMLGFVFLVPLLISIGGNRFSEIIQ